MAEAVPPLGSGILFGCRRKLDLAVGLEVVLLVLELVQLLELGLAVAVPVPFAAFWFAAISSVSMPASASIWWRRSSVPDFSRGGRSLSTRSRPSIRA